MLCPGGALLGRVCVCAGHEEGLSLEQPQVPQYETVTKSLLCPSNQRLYGSEKEGLEANASHKH